MVLCHQHQDIVNVDFYLLHQFHFKNNVIQYAVFAARLWLDFFVYIVIYACIVLKINGRQDFVSCKTVKGGQNISQAENIAKQHKKVFFILFPCNRLP